MKKLYFFYILAFMLTGIPSYAQYTTLLNFRGTTNGEFPRGDLISDGTFLYGMTYEGGTSDFGTIFKIMPDGSGYAKLMDFSGTTNGRYPHGSLVSDGTFLYGMTKWGGTNGFGVIFKIMPDGTGFTKLLDFAGNSNGNDPRGSLIIDGTFLYGMTNIGGTNSDGNIFKIRTDGTGFVNLFSFADEASGKYPQGSLVADGAFLYGMTEMGGTNNLGTVFKILPDGNGYEKLLDFKGGTNGSLPGGNLISDGTFLYGLTQRGGTNDLGTAFKLMHDGSGYSKLIDFAGATNGRYPLGSLVSDGSFLYGMTWQGGANSFGTIFKILPDGNDYLKLMDFPVNVYGRNPWGSLISDGAFLYGLTEQGGTVGGKGVVFKFSLSSVGVDELSTNNDDLLVYPNPASDNITIPTNAVLKNDPLKIYNATGENVYDALITNSQQTITRTIDINQWAQGLYFVRIGNQTKKLIISR